MMHTRFRWYDRLCYVASYTPFVRLSLREMGMMAKSTKIRLTEQKVIVVLVFQLQWTGKWKCYFKYVSSLFWKAALWLTWPTCFRMASRSLSRTKSSLSCTLVSLVLRGSENSWKKLSSGSKLPSVWTNSIYLLEANRQRSSKASSAMESVISDRLKIGHRSTHHSRVD